MKKIAFIILIFISAGHHLNAQQPDKKSKPVKNEPLKKLPGKPVTPDIIWKTLFTDIQLKKVLGDNKTFVDAVPKFPPAVILKKYNSEKNKSSFDLKNFITD